MEDTLTLEELYLLIDASRKVEHRNHKFLAAMQGVDLDEGSNDAAFEKVKMKAMADLEGKSEEEFVFDMIGIEVDDDDE